MNLPDKRIQPLTGDSENAQQLSHRACWNLNALLEPAFSREQTEAEAVLHWYSKNHPYTGKDCYRAAPPLRTAAQTTWCCKGCPRAYAAAFRAQITPTALIASLEYIPTWGVMITLSSVSSG